jgi:RNA polymerase sigma-32 factor
MARNAAPPILTAEPGLTHYLEEIRRFPTSLKRISAAFGSH